MSLWWHWIDTAGPCPLPLWLMTDRCCYENSPAARATSIQVSQAPCRGPTSILTSGWVWRCTLLTSTQYWLAHMPKGWKRPSPHQAASLQSELGDMRMRPDILYFMLYRHFQQLYKVRIQNENINKSKIFWHRTKTYNFLQQRRKWNKIQSTIPFQFLLVGSFPLWNFTYLKI